MVKVAINGYGRIGRVAHRVILQKHSSDIDVVAINAGSSTDLQGWAYLLKYDSNYGVLEGHEVTVKADPKPEGEEKQTKLGALIIDGKEIPVYSQKDATLLPWGDLGVDVVIECTGHFLTKEKAQAHIQAGVCWLQTCILIYYAYGMQDIVGRTFLGGAVVLCGLVLFALHVLDVIKTPYPWLMDIASILFLLIGIFLLVRAKLTHDEVIKNTINPNIDAAVTAKGPSLIERQQQMGQEWDDTTTKRDKLKMLKMASAAEEG